MNVKFSTAPTNSLPITYTFPAQTEPETWTYKVDAVKHHIEI